MRRLVRDLDMPVRIDVRPTVREPDGLALSSRNVHLSADERERALSLGRALAAARAAVAAGERDAASVRASAESQLEHVETDYVAVVDPETFQPIADVNGRALVAVAARVGTTRLIDNIEITTGSHP